MKTMSAFSIPGFDRKPEIREDLVADDEWASLLELPVAGPLRDDGAAEELWDRLMRVRNLKQGHVKFALASL